MLEKFAKFFLENEKITIVFITIIAFFWIGAYIMLPKQYNPSIVAPAFNIQMPVNWYSSSDASHFVARSLENKVKELEWVDKIMSYTTDNFASVMISFKVWISQEIAKTRLYDKMYSNYDLRPFEVNDIIIKSIDPEELPQLSLAITYNWKDLSEKEQWVYLRWIWNDLKEELKLVPNTTVIEVLGWYEDDISITLNKGKIESFWLDIWQVIMAIKSSSIYKTVWNLESGSKTVLLLSSNLNSKKDLSNLLIYNMWWSKIYLRDVATITSGPVNFEKYFEYSDKNTKKTTVLLWIAKMKWTNAVFVVEDVLKRIEELKEKLPKNVSINVIQDEWETAKEATNELTFHLFVSIFIVLAILIVFLWLKNALNAAFCIPMVLWIVFIVALMFWLDINRITLFALILSLWILVDDSIVVVENNARHLSDMHRTWLTKAQALLESVKEVWPSVVLSTITRVMSFVAMFAVTWMMGDYMKPIPIFASIALTASLFVAFSINPFLASKFCKWWNCASHEEHDKESFVIKRYWNLISKYISDTIKAAKSRKALKAIFWVTLFVIMISPIMLGIFKARMLPKADKNQVYIWIDAPRDYSVEKTKMIESDMSDFILWKVKWLPKELDIAENVSSTIWDRFLWDFANLFRWGSNRMMPNQISSRINLVSNKERDLKSEAYTIKLRPLLKNYLYSKYPDIKFRLLEDPPGPPTMATFHIKAKWQEDLSSGELYKFADAVESTVRKIAAKQKLADLTDTVSSPYKKLTILINDDYMAQRGISANQVYETLWGIYNWMQVSFVHSDSRKIEPSRIMVYFDKKDIWSRDFLKNIYFSNQKWERVKLDEIASVEEWFAWNEIYTDSRSAAVHIYAELWDNSVVYPVLELYDLFWSSDFVKLGYKKIASSPYWIDFVWTKDWKSYRIEWWWEWEITMDTFRDLGKAMIMSLLGIFFLIVAQFKSFRVWWIVMTTFLLSFFGIFPGFSILYLLKWEYFTATAMIWAIALWGIVVWNAIILIDYIDQLVKEWKGLAYSVIEWSKKRFIPVLLTSIAAVFWSFIITSDPVWSGLAWSIIWWLSASALLTLFFIPIFYYDFLIKYHKDEPAEVQLDNIIKHRKEISHNENKDECTDIG